MVTIETKLIQIFKKNSDYVTFLHYISGFEKSCYSRFSRSVRNRKSSTKFAEFEEVLKAFPLKPNCSTLAV